MAYPYTPPEEEEYTPPEVDQYQAPEAPDPLEVPAIPGPDVRPVTEQETVAGQMKGLLASDSPYIQDARQKGKEYASSRGLLSSSMGAGASQRAAIETALPIAQQDAATYETAGRTAKAHQQLQQSDAFRQTLQDTSQMRQAEYANQATAERERVQQAQAFRTKQMETESENQRYFANLNLQADELTANMSMENKRAFSESSANMSQQYWKEISALYQQDIKSGLRDQGLTKIKQGHTDSMNLLAAQYNVEMTWTT